MLARSFLTDAELGISEVEHGALVATLHAFERGEIKRFHMITFFVVGAYECQTPSCLCGWAHHLSGGEAFPELGMEELTQRDIAQQLRQRLPHNLSVLFALIDSASLNYCTHFATKRQATTALANYLTTGEARWAEAFA